MNLFATIANSLWLGSNLPTLVQFRRALDRPMETQRQLLRSYLSRNADSAYGRAHGFSEITRYQEYAARVPLNHYEDFQPWIERIMRGERGLLTTEPVTHLIPTSGSSGPRKFIPFTAGLQRDLDHAIGPWIANLYTRQPTVALGPAYWSISPAIQMEDSERSALPVGFEDDASYLGGAKKRLAQAVMAVPPELRLVSDLEHFRYLTWLCLLRHPDLRLISVWHPSFLLLLLEALPARWENLLSDLKTGRCCHADSLSAQVLRALKLRPMPGRARHLAEINPKKPEEIWPHLKIISCWGDANAGYGLAELRRHFPHVIIQPKGLIATEAMVTIPFSNGHPLAIGSHFFEFIDGQGEIHLAHELEIGETYEVVVTTGAGLWRYRLQDQVRVTGFIGQTPSLYFLGRSGNISDRFGEKLSEAFVAQAISEAMAGMVSPPRFVLLAPDEDHSGCRYTLYVEGEIQNELGPCLETLLQKNTQYAWCRKLEQLKPLRLFQIESGGHEIFINRELSQGKRLGEIKPCSLSPKTGWTELFKGDYLTRHNAENISN
jgi:hypothetical protein